MRMLSLKTNQPSDRGAEQVCCGEIARFIVPLVTNDSARRTTVNVLPLPGFMLLGGGAPNGLEQSYGVASFLLPRKR